MADFEQNVMAVSRHMAALCPYGGFYNGFWAKRYGPPYVIDYTVQEEYNALIKNNTWTLVSLPPNRESIGCKWVFRIKENPDGTVNKYKARLVAKRYHQHFGYDYIKTFSPVI
jgi:hypothetical protein